MRFPQTWKMTLGQKFRGLSPPQSPDTRRLWWPVYPINTCWVFSLLYYIALYFHVLLLFLF